MKWRNSQWDTVVKRKLTSTDTSFIYTSANKEVLLNESEAIWYIGLYGN